MTDRRDESEEIGRKNGRATPGALPPLHEIMHVDPRVLAILGRTVEELAVMGLAEFAELSYAKGIVWKVSTETDGPKGLVVRIEEDPVGAAPGGR